jgi:hypothetical protein
MNLNEIMLAQPWNTVAKWKILVDRMELLLKTMEEVYGGATRNILK